MIQLKEIGHVLLRVLDLERSKKFYSEVLGFHVLEEDPEHGGTFMALEGQSHAIDLFQVKDLDAAQQQRMAYPDIGPLGTNATAQNAYRAAYAVMSKHKDSFVAPYWRVIAAREPVPGRRDGRIEAIAYSSLLGFRDDVIVRVRADPDGARIDVRSSSRYGTFDFGTNAARVRTLINDIEDAIRALRPERPQGPPPGKKKATPAGRKNQPKQ